MAQEIGNTNWRAFPRRRLREKLIDKNKRHCHGAFAQRSHRAVECFRPGAIRSLHHEELLPKVRHAGSVFIGPYSPEAAGDYATGPNHVLPTNGAARLRGGLSAADYVKVISVQQLDVTALENLAPAITTLARAEGLEAHARSIEVRIESGAA